MSYILFSAAILFNGYLWYKKRRLNKRKKELMTTIKNRFLTIDKHLKNQEQMLECFYNTKDPDFIQYGVEELEKAENLVKLNNNDIEEMKHL